jgi:hypothetical protein
LIMENSPTNLRSQSSSSALIRLNCCQRLIFCVKRQTLNDSKQSAILGYEAVCASIVAGAVLLFPADKKSLVSPILGGLLVGLSQAANLLLTGNALGGTLLFPLPTNC